MKCTTPVVIAIPACAEVIVPAEQPAAKQWEEGQAPLFFFIPNRCHAIVIALCPLLIIFQYWRR